MSTSIIDADAAKLAGLQIDTLQKVRSGQITFGQWERFNNLSTEDREARFGDSKPKPANPPDPKVKFGLLVDLGIITVPDDYVHKDHLDTFRRNHEKEFYYYNSDITDKNFKKPTRVLKPGDRLHVRAFKQIVPGRTTSEERMAFLATQKAVHTGAQGATLVWEQKRDQLPKGKWYCSFDEKDRLPDLDGYHRVPYVGAHSGGGFDLGLGGFESGWDDGGVLLCFCDVEPAAGK